jgi:iron-sulfur cluster assembly accessory protein
VIEITPAAASKLSALRGGDPSRAYLRVWVAGRTCSGYQYSLAFDEKAEDDDSVLEESGIPVAIDAQSSLYCDGATIDYIDETEGPGGFIVTNAKFGGEGCGGGCSCGH